MNVEAIELRRISMRLVSPFVTAHGTYDTVEKLLVRAHTPDADGWGELGTDAPPAQAGAFLDAAADALSREAPRATDAPATRPSAAPASAARAALETAVLDAELRVAGESLASRLGAQRRRVPSGVALGITGTIDALLGEAARRIEEGYQRLKLKIEPGWDVEPLAALRDRFGAVPAQVDANGSYGPDDVEHLASLDRFDLLMIEQPFPVADLDSTRALVARARTPVCLDESLSSFEAVERALDEGLCSVVNVKPGRVGGLHEARRIHDLCVDRGVPLWCGGMLETGIGRAANLALAALPGFTLPGDLSASARYWATDLTVPFVLDDEGFLAVPTGSGIGVEPIPAVLDEATVSVATLSARD